MDASLAIIGTAALLAAGLIIWAGRSCTAGGQRQ